MTPWHRHTLVAFDLETTGVDPTQARAVTACVVVIGGGSIHEKNWLIDPGVEIPAEAASIHGVTTEKARTEGRPAAEALTEIVKCLEVAWSAGYPVVGHNVGYDLTLLDHDLARHGLAGVAERGGPGFVVDTLALDRMVDRYRKGKRTLTAAAKHYDVRLDGAHNAGFDAVCSARIAWRIAELYPDQVQIPLDELMAAQAASHADWATEFQAYLRKNGQPDAVIDTAWPMRARAGVAA